MKRSVHRTSLLLTGLSVVIIGLAYCMDPNLLLQRYGLAAVSSASEDSMYRGAYGGLFITMGAAMCFGVLDDVYLKFSTLIALIFMGGFAFGRACSILVVGMPHDLIVGLFGFEIVSTIVFGWFCIMSSDKDKEKTP